MVRRKVINLLGEIFDWECWTMFLVYDSILWRMLPEIKATFLSFSRFFFANCLVGLIFMFIIGIVLIVKYCMELRKIIMKREGTEV